jgi:hypothetical protein
MATARSYNAFIKAVRHSHDLTLKEAQAAYRRMTEHLGRPAKGVDVARHPRITKQETAAARSEVKKESRRAARESKAAEKRTRAAAPRGAAAKAAPFKSLADYLDWFEEADFYDYEEADGTVDY